MTEEELLDAKLLYKFLKKKCVLYAYITNVMEQRRVYDDVKKFHKKGDILGIINLFYSSISCSFDWLDTKEGFRFWRHLNFEFFKFKDNFDI